VRDHTRPGALLASRRDEARQHLTAVAPHGRPRQHRAATPGKRRNAHGHKRTGHAFVHTVVDDYRPVA
jgi:hypothetical protein